MSLKLNHPDQKTIEENKRKQDLINMRLGTSLKVDGSWGPYQQQLYDKATLKDKEYPTTVTGLVNHAIDWFTGDTKYRDDQPDAMRQVGDQKTDDSERNIDPTYGFDTTGMTPEEVQSERNKRYFHTTLGTRARWSVSMNNDTNPLVGLGRTFLPAAEAAATVTGIPAAWNAGKAAVTHPQLVTKVVKGVGNTVKNTRIGETVTNAVNKGVRLAKYWKHNPSKMLTGVGKLTARTARDFGLGMTGGAGVNFASKLTTGNDWGHLVELGIGVSPELGEWTNPGYLIGGGISHRLGNLISAKGKLKTRVNGLMRQSLKLDNEISQLEKTKGLDLYNNTITARGRLRGKLTEYESAQRAEDAARQAWEDANPHSEKIASYDRQARAANNRTILSDELHPDYFDGIPRRQVAKHPILTTSESQPSTIKFTNPIGGTTVSETFVPYSTGRQYFLNPRREIHFNSKGEAVIPSDTDIYVTSSETLPLYRPNESKVNSEIGKYVSELNQKMGGDGLVAGSAVHHANNIFPGTVGNSGLRGPADTEIYTTAARKNSLMQRLGFKQNGTNSTGGAHGTSPLTFRNNDGAHSGIDTEINVIQEDANGHATGKIAHQIYRTLFPDEYSKMAYDHSMKPGNVITEDLPLPMSAEELFQALKNPDNMENHLLNDMLGMNTFGRADKVKGSQRVFQALFNTAEGIPEKVSKAMNTWGRSNLGSNFKSATELYPNLNLSDVAANKDFVMKVYGVSEEVANTVAQNPKAMANLINYYNWSYSTGTRLVGSDVVSETAANGLQLHNPKIEMFSGNGSFAGGNGSGNGLNRALLNPEGGWHLGDKQRGGLPMDRITATQTPLTLHPENIKSPLDLYNQVERLKGLDPYDPKFIAGNLITNLQQRDVPFTYDLNRMQEIKKLAYSHDTPVNLNMGSYGFGYSGSYVEPIAVGVRTANRPGNSFELGSLFKDLPNQQGERIMFGKILTKTQNDIQSNLSNKFQWPFTEWTNSTPSQRMKLIDKMNDNSDFLIHFQRRATKQDKQWRLANDKSIVSYQEELKRNGSPDYSESVLKDAEDRINAKFDYAKKLKEEWLSKQHEKGLIGREVKRIKSDVKNADLQRTKFNLEEIQPLQNKIHNNNMLIDRITLNPPNVSYKPTWGAVRGTIAGIQPLTLDNEENQ